MIKQIKCLSWITLCNTFGWNEARFGRDVKKRRRVIGLGLTFVFLCLLLAFYSGGLAFAYAMLGMEEIISGYLFAVTSLVILFFSLFKAESILFNKRFYEKTIVLPLSPAVIVLSRFFTMYVFNLLLGLLVVLPGAVIYAWASKPAASFYPMLLIGIVLLPLLPLTIAAALGAVIFAIASKVKHTNLVTIFLSLVLMGGLLFFSFQLSFHGENIDEQKLAELSGLLLEKIGQIYPPAIWFSKGVAEGSLGYFLLFVLCSVALFTLLILAVQKNYEKICSALTASHAKGNYVMKELPQSSMLKALYRKEIRRYFASSIYVMNSSIGYLLMAVFSVGVSVAGLDKIEAILNINGIVVDIIPLLLSAMCVLCSTTASSISLEGKQWWIIKTLPVKTGVILNSKILVNLTVALPCYAVSVILLAIMLPMGGMEYLWLFLLPLLYILFTSVLGVAVNLKFPIFNWEEEVTVVKQSAAMLLCMVFGMVSVFVPFLLYALLPNHMYNLLWGATAIVIAGFTLFLYNVICRTSLQHID